MTQSATLKRASKGKYEEKWEGREERKTENEGKKKTKD
jgi:hypothetical protein